MKKQYKNSVKKYLAKQLDKPKPTAVCVINSFEAFIFFQISQEMSARYFSP
jgi:hypothetical protein